MPRGSVKIELPENHGTVQTLNGSVQVLEQVHTDFFFTHLSPSALSPYE